MSVSFEQLVVDPNSSNPLTLTGDLTGVYQLEDLDLGLAQRRPTWIGGPESDGQLLVVDPPYDDATMTMTVRIFPAVDGSMDGALQALQALTLKMQECSASGPDGVPVTYSASNLSTDYTCYWKLAEFDGAPPITPSGDTAGWFLAKPVVKIKVQRKPFFYRPEIASVTDSFSSNTIANYTFDAGAGTMSVSGGQLVPSSTAEKRLVRSVGGYDCAGGYYDAQATLKLTTGAAVTSSSTDVIVKRLSNGDHLVLDWSPSGLQFYKNVAGSYTGLGSVVGGGPATGTSYWLRARVEGNVLYGERWNSAPTATGTPTSTVTTTLAGADATKFGQGVLGKYGLRAIPPATDWRYDDFTVDPNVAVSSNPLLTMTLPGVPGDVDAEARLIVTDRANQARRYLEWGLQQRYNQGLALEIDNGAMTLLGGTSTTRAGSVNTNVVRGTLTTSPSALAATGSLSHIGTFRVRARVYASSATVYVRLSWQDGSGIFRANDYALANQVGGWSDVDLGTISISQAASGTQQWSGRIEAYSTTSGDTVDLDYVLLFPSAEGYGKARAAYSYTPGAIVAWDTFTSTTAGSALNARAAPLGGSWATSGVATDFAFADAPAATDETISRTPAPEASPRFAILGTTNYTDVEVGSSFYYTPAGTKAVQQGVIARWTDASNYCHLTETGSALRLRTVVAGVVSTLATTNYVTIPNTWYQLRLIVFASGRAIGYLLDSNGGTLATVTGTSTALATGGTLATGTPGLRDQGGDSATRYFDNFYAATPASEPLVLYAGRSAEIRSDDAERYDSGGTILGPVPSYYGAHIFVPQAGTANRTARIAVRAARNDLEAVAYDNASGDSAQAQLALTPRHLLPK